MPLNEVMRLGRADDNHTVLRDRFVSSHHAEISREAGGYVLRDLGSTNGTFRNGARLDKSVVLQEGDRIGIGTSMFTFHS
ncbi:FHA domain-containing protein, partial [Citrobacter sp. AAK_AS5]